MRATRMTRLDERVRQPIQWLLEVLICDAMPVTDEERTMARGSLRRYDVQANYGFILAILSLFPFLAALALVVRNYRSNLNAIVYKAGGMYRWVFLGLLAVAILSALTAAALGVSSAGQRRNQNQGRSWAGFLIGGAVVAFSIVLLYAFRELGLAVRLGGA
jgi:uncharacterized membrane protein